MIAKASKPPVKGRMTMHEDKGASTPESAKGRDGGAMAKMAGPDEITREKVAMSSLKQVLPG